MTTYLDVYWIPLGSGGHCVRLSGRTYELARAVVGRRRALDLYHAALLVHLDGVTTTIEVAPQWQDAVGPEWPVAPVVGPVGMRGLGRWALFRYEVRCRPGGTIPDLDEAVDSPQRVSTDERQCRAVLDLAGQVPPLTWGRDEQRLGEMWNSNSVVAWLLLGAGVDPGPTQPPRGGSAPGWRAGILAASGGRAEEVVPHG